MSRFDRIVRDSAEDIGVAAPRLVEAPVGDAATDGDNLYYDPGFTRELDRDGGGDALRYVAGHELGHVRAGLDPGPAGELTSDRTAGRLLARSGADVDAIMTVFGHLTPADDSTHPPVSVRERAATRAYLAEQARDPLARRMHHGRS